MCRFFPKLKMERITHARPIDFGLAALTRTKEEREEEADRTQTGIEQKYAEERFGRRFETLSDAERDEIWIAIIIASGRGRLDGIWFEDNVRQFIIFLAALASFIGGTAAALAVVVSVSNPFLHFLSNVLIVVGPLVGGATYKVLNYFWRAS